MILLISTRIWHVEASANRFGSLRKEYVGHLQDIFEGIRVAEVGLGKIHGFACILGSRFIELHGFHGFWDPDSWILMYCEIQIQWFATNSQIIGSRL